MSQENMEIVRRAYQAFNENGLAGASEFWDPAIVWHTDPMVPEPGVYTGFDTVRTYLEGFARAFGTWHISTHEFLDLGGDVILVAAEQGESVLLVAGSLTDEIGVLTDRVQRHAGRTEPDAHDQPVDVVLGIDAPAVRLPPYPVCEQSLTLVEPERVHAQPGPLGHLPDTQSAHRAP